jgi:uncharacterized membrane protein
VFGFTRVAKVIERVDSRSFPMLNLLSKIKPLLTPLLILSLVFTFALGNANSALAASGDQVSSAKVSTFNLEKSSNTLVARRGGGRIGGGGFRRSPSPNTSPRGGTRGPGGGFGFPFLLPFFGVGGFGSLFTILIFFAIANFVVRTIRNGGIGGDATRAGYGGNPKVTVAELQVGLLADARSLQKELDELARTADTNAASGRSLLLQEATLALLRHPEYWVYATAESQQAPLESAEAKFNQLALAERSKFSEETLSNVSGQVSQNSSQASASDDGEQPSEYILVTLLVGVQGNLQLPTVNSSDELRQALRQMGGFSSDQLLAIEVLWTPQAEGDTLTSDDLLASYPNLKLI